MIDRSNGDLFPAVRSTPAEVPKDERYTTRRTLDLCRRLAGVERFDLDVAGCQEAHHAPRFYGAKDDGLSRAWDAARVWCNPPFSEIAPWVAKAWSEPAPVVIAMLLPAWTDRAWWSEHVEPFRDGRAVVGGFSLATYFLPRLAFGHPGNPEGIGAGSPPFWCALLVWRRAS